MKDSLKQILILVGFFVVVFILIIIFSKNSVTVVDINRLEGFQTMEKLAEFSGCELPTDKNYDSFAKCLTENGLAMYGAEGCSHCKDQKNAFGESFQYIKYVECPDNVNLCLDKGVDGYPSWIKE